MTLVVDTLFKTYYNIFVYLSILSEEKKHEANLSAQEKAKQQGAWISPENEERKRPERAEAQAYKRKKGYIGVELS